MGLISLPITITICTCIRIAGAYRRLRVCRHAVKLTKHVQPEIQPAYTTGVSLSILCHELMKHMLRSNLQHATHHLHCSQCHVQFNSANCNESDLMTKLCSGRTSGQSSYSVECIWYQAGTAVLAGLPHGPALLVHAPFLIVLQ